jgi:uncharacterized membrane protein (DUF485 family)
MADNVPPLAPPLGTPNLRAMLPDLVIDGALPAIAYQILSRHGVGDVAALTAGAIFPAANIIRKFVATRRLDLVGAIVLVFIAIGVVTSLISGNVMFVLIKESFITGTVGLLFLSSLLWRRPIIFYLARQFAAGDDPERLAWWNGMWERPRFRTIMRTMTVVWGVGYVLEAGIRVVFALTLTPGTVVIVSPIMAIGTTILLIIWTRRYVRAAQERAMREAGLQAPAPAS